MSIPVLILGEPGSGKSYSLRNFNSDEIGVIQTIAKPLPFRASMSVASALVPSDEHDKRTPLARAESWANNITDKPVLVFDDFGYFITDQWTKGKDGFAIYKEIGTSIYNFIMSIMADGQTDRIAYFVMHEEKSDDGTVQPLTLGKLLNEKIKIMGLFTVALHSIARGGEYLFVTNGQPFKSPPDMFELEIPNDLKAVDTTIRDYYGLKPLSDPSTPAKAGEAS